MLFVITDSQLCKDNFLERIEKIAKSNPNRIILREKHLAKAEYKILAEKCLNICKKYNIPFSINTFTDIAEELNISDIHIPFYMIKNNPLLIDKFKVVGASVHNVDEAKTAEKLGVSYIIAGHIFATDCKKDLKPRGLEFLKNIKSAVKIPVFAIGGITAEKVKTVLQNGADGICVMSHFMKCDNIECEIDKFK